MRAGSSGRLHMLLKELLEILQSFRRSRFDSHGRGPRRV